MAVTIGRNYIILCFWS